MKVVKNLTCQSGQEGICHETLALTNLDLTSVLHEPNNHVLIFKNDYSDRGVVKASSVTNQVLDDMDLDFKKKFEVMRDKEFR